MTKTTKAVITIGGFRTEITINILITTADNHYSYCRQKEPMVGAEGEEGKEEKRGEERKKGVRVERGGERGGDWGLGGEGSFRGKSSWAQRD